MAEEQTSDPDARDREMRSKMLSRLNEWRKEGYNTSAMEELLVREPNIRQVKAAFLVFKEKVKGLRDIELELTMLDSSGFETRFKEIRDRLHDVPGYETVKADFEGLKAALADRTRKMPAPRSIDRDALLLKVKEWAGRGYDVLRVEKFIKGETDTQKVITTIEALEKKIGVLDKVRSALAQMETTGFEADVRRIERMAKQMERTDRIWEEVYALKEKLKERRKEVVKAEATTKPVKMTVKKKVIKVPTGDKTVAKSAGPEEAEAVEAKETTETVQFRRIDLYTQMLQNILLTNKRLLTLDTLRLAQRALKNDFPKVMFFLIQPDFKIKSMMPDHPDSYKALEAFLNKLYATLSGLLGEDDAKERLRGPAKEFINSHIQEILASGLDDYFPMFLIIDESQLPEERLEPKPGSEEDDWHEIVGKIKAWLDEGYKIDRLVQAMDGNRELAKALFRKTEEEIFWLKELDRDVHELEKKLGHRKELDEIRKKLLYPERITEIEDDILSLQMMIDMGDEGAEDSDLI